MFDSTLKRFWKIWEWGIGRTVAATIAAHTTSISVGMCQGYSAVLLPQLKEDSYVNITTEEESWIASLGVISTPGGALIAGLASELLGRKATVQLTSVPFLVGWATIALSNNKFALCVGRFVSGLAIGMASACYIYVAEISLPNHRGFLSAFGPIFVSLGVLVVYSLGYFLYWQEVAVLCAVVAVLSFIVMHFVPESPSWLASKELVTEAKTSLSWLRRNPAMCDSELANILQSLKVAKKQSEQGSSMCSLLKQCSSPSVWKPFFILTFFFIFQEGSGIYIVLYYAVHFFQKIGSSLDSNVASILVATVRLFMSIIGAICIQHFKRKTLAMISGMGMGLSMAICGLHSYLYGHLPVEDRMYRWMPLLCVVINVCFSMLGMLQLPWLMTGELFPLAMRGLLGGLVSSLAYLFIFGTIKIYPGLEARLDQDKVMWIFSAFSFCVVIYVKLFLPETRGKSLHEIEMKFKREDYTEKDKDFDQEANKTPNEVYIISRNDY
ncbi:hypothetical protein LSTR_LSTR005304 [Laodelphax striatellus]|uniref:Major facilitator superfamily (MFS) profile domain-containing protein n=1 Tax=Laodelphax striatellus TaxID=195883 RepID=A0A482X830_LAOST|nr:hypothetical protein LSTR_LSTR005304 [Laodelphax striatellus]